MISTNKLFGGLIKDFKDATAERNSDACWAIITTLHAILIYVKMNDKKSLPLLKEKLKEHGGHNRILTSLYSSI